MSSKLRGAACVKVNFGCKLHPPTRTIRVPDDMARMPRKPSSTGWHCQKTKATCSLTIRELYAGVSVRDRRIIERLERDFDRARRILVPNLNDWTQAGKVLARLGREFGYELIGRARLTNDALIAMSAARQGITVITANERDFARLARFRPFLWEVKTLPAS